MHLCKDIHWTFAEFLRFSQFLSGKVFPPNRRLQVVLIEQSLLGVYQSDYQDKMATLSLSDGSSVNFQDEIDVENLVIAEDLVELKFVEAVSKALWQLAENGSSYESIFEFLQNLKTDIIFPQQVIALGVEEIVKENKEDLLFRLHGLVQNNSVVGEHVFAFFSQQIGFENMSAIQQSATINSFWRIMIKVLMKLLKMDCEVNKLEVEMSSTIRRDLNVNSRKQNFQKQKLRKVKNKELQWIARQKFARHSVMVPRVTQWSSRKFIRRIARPRTETEDAEKINKENVSSHKENVVVGRNIMPQSIRVTNNILAETGAEVIPQVPLKTVTVSVPVGAIILMPQNPQPVQNVELIANRVEQAREEQLVENMQPENQNDSGAVEPEQHLSCAYPGCSRTFTSIRSSDRHFRLCHMQGKLCECPFPDCGRSFTLPRLLEAHACVHRGEKPHACEFPGCGKRFTWKKGLSTHRKVHMAKKPNKPFACEVVGCARGFVSQQSLELHMLKHTKDKPFMCPFNCGMSFSEKRYLALHKRKRHEEKRFACAYPDCGAKFHDSESRLLHVRRVHTGEKPYECQFEGCDRRFVTTNERKAHFVAKHSGEKPFECKVPDCGKRFSTSSGLSAHKKCHSESEVEEALDVARAEMAPTSQPGVRKKRRRNHKPGEYVCDFPDCGKKFVWQTGLHKHRKLHKEKKPFECSIDGCNMGFNYKRELKQHALTHSVQKPFACPFNCGKYFTHNSYLEIHKRKEHRENKFLCKVPGCGMRFYSYPLRLEHMRRMHTGEKPFACPFEGCEACFVTAKEKKAHWMTHTGKKMYECKVEGCGKMYSARSSLGTHVKKCHKTPRTVELDGIIFELTEMIRRNTP